MKRLLLTACITAILVFTGKPIAAHLPSANGNFVCMPCGRDCDKPSFDKGGTCNACGMNLVPQKSIVHRNIQAENVCTYIKTHPQAILLDVRTHTEFEGKADPDFGTLKNAINIPIQELNKRMRELSSLKNREILVFCSHSHRSPQASFMLTQNGFTKVTNMLGGMSVVTDASCKK